MKRVVYSAPHSVYLLGEEGIPFGKPALACAIDQRVFFTLIEGKKIIPHEKVDFVSQQVRNYLTRKNIFFTLGSYTWEIRDDSHKKLTWMSAYFVAACAAFFAFYTGRAAQIEVINKLAYEVEKHYDPHSCGVLTSAATFGGLIFFRKEFAFLKSLYQLPFKIPQSIQKHLYIVAKKDLSKNKASEISLLDYYRKQPKQADVLLSIMEKSVKQLTIAITKEDPIFFKDAFLNYQNAVKKALKSSYKGTKAPYVLYFSDNMKDMIPFKESYEGVRKEKV